MSSVYVWPVVPLDGVNADADDRIREKSSVSAAVISLVSVNYFFISQTTCSILHRPTVGRTPLDLQFYTILG